MSDQRYPVMALLRGGPLADRVVEVDYHLARSRVIFPVEHFDLAAALQDTSPVLLPTELLTAEYRFKRGQWQEEYGHRFLVRVEMEFVIPAEVRWAHERLNELRKKWGMGTVAL